MRGLLVCALLALAIGCKKKEEDPAAQAPPAETPPATAPAETPVPAPAPAPAAATPDEVPVPAASAEEVVVPDLKGKTVVEAIQALMNGGLLARLGDSKEVKGVVPGTVVAQAPAAGQKVERLTVIALTPADAPPPPPTAVDIPPVKGQTVEQARLTLFERGFTPRVGKPAFTGGAPGKIVEQKPTGKAPKGTEVLITPEKRVILVPDLRRQPLVDGVLRLRKLDLDWNGKEREDKGAAPGTIVDQDPKPGANVDHDTVITLTVAKGTSMPKYAGDPDDVQKLSRKDVEELTRVLGKVLPKTYVTGIEVEPGTTVQRRIGERVEISFDYSTEHVKDVWITVAAYHDGKRVAVAPMHQKVEADGQGAFKASFTSYLPLQDVGVDELRILMYRTQGVKPPQTLLKTSVPVRIRFTVR